VSAPQKSGSCLDHSASPPGCGVSGGVHKSPRPNRSSTCKCAGSAGGHRTLHFAHSHSPWPSASGLDRNLPKCRSRLRTVCHDGLRDGEICWKFSRRRILARNWRSDSPELNLSRESVSLWSTTRESCCETVPKFSAVELTGLSLMATERRP